jgi:hypothetical protein
VTDGRGPDFLGIGSPRCGTTTLYERLRTHPEVWLPPVKELHYWDVERGPDRPTHGRWGRVRFGISRARRSRTRHDLAFMVRFATGRRSDDWYERLFPADSSVCRGEITPSYCELDDDRVAAVHRRLPDVKLILMLRDPIERTWSGAAKRLARQEGRHLSEISEAELRDYFDSAPVRRRADYVAILDRWRSVFDPAALHVGFLEQMNEEPDVFATGVAGHLGIDPEPLRRAGEVTVAVNTTTSHRIDIPVEWERYLARQYVGVSEAMAAEFGGPAVAWYERARASLAA